MAKKGKDPVPTVNSVSNRDILQRLNFLYQASAYLSSLAPPQSIPNVNGNTSRNAKRERRRKDRHPATTSDLSRSYVKSLRIIGQKTNVRTDPTIKRTLCKNCNTVLLPGTTARTRVLASPCHGHIVAYRCNACRTARNIPAPPVLDPEAEESATVQEQPSQLAQSTLQSNAEETLISLDKEGNAATPQARSTPSRGKRRKVKPRIPPLFERKVGHVVFCGGEILPEQD